MANQEQLDILNQGVETWNQWRIEHADVEIDLIGADLSGATLSGATLSEVTLSRADLSGATLSEANLGGATLIYANLSGADLGGAILSYAHLSFTTLSGADLNRATLYQADLGYATLSGANLTRANLSGADLSFADLTGANFSNANLIEANLRRATLNNADFTGANFSNANLIEADLSGANLSGADLSFATFVGTTLKGTTLTECHIYGISAWDIELTGALQDSLVITPPDEPVITVDNLKIAQFIYLLLNNQEIRDVINTITTKVVLILGRFTSERKAVLDELREALRKQDYLPILFDFEKPSSRNLTETVSTLAHLARFIIADLTDPSSIPQELYAIVPTLAVPVRPVLLEGKKEYAMLIDLLSTYHWVLPIHFYKDQADLITTLKEEVIEPAEQKAKELEKP